MIQFKVIHRLHYSKTKLHTIFPNVSSICNNCKISEGTLSHLFWTCHKIRPFWQSIFRFISEAYNIYLPPEAKLGTFGDTSDIGSKYVSQAVSLCILQKWKSESVPVFEVWLRDLSYVLPLEELRYKISDRQKIFSRIWNPIKCLINNFDL